MQRYKESALTAGPRLRNARPCRRRHSTGDRSLFKTEPGRGIYHDTTTWRYRFEPTGDGANLVTEGYEFTAPRWLQTMDAMLGRPRALRSGVPRTLANLKRGRRMCRASGP